MRVQRNSCAAGQTVQTRKRFDVGGEEPTPRRGVADRWADQPGRRGAGGPGRAIDGVDRQHVRGRRPEPRAAREHRGRVTAHTGRAADAARQRQMGAAVWAAGGLTAQINRTDTWPTRRSPGQVTIPGLAAMTQASDYSASVDLYDATYRQQGGGMTATTLVRADKDELIVDVTGADPSSTQTARINLQSGRNPTAGASGAIARLAETWVDTGSAPAAPARRSAASRRSSPAARTSRRPSSTPAPSRFHSSPTATARSGSSSPAPPGPEVTRRPRRPP
jgi:hypothetical protein